MDATWKTRTARGCCRLWRRVHLDAGAVRAHGVAAWRHLEELRPRRGGQRQKTLAIAPSGAKLNR
jgi:hypothetical protein